MDAESGQSVDGSTRAETVSSDNSDSQADRRTALETGRSESTEERVGKAKAGRSAADVGTGTVAERRESSLQVTSVDDASASHNDLRPLRHDDRSHVASVADAREASASKTVDADSHEPDSGRVAFENGQSARSESKDKDHSTIHGHEMEPVDLNHSSGAADADGESLGNNQSTELSAQSRDIETSPARHDSVQGRRDYGRQPDASTDKRTAGDSPEYGATANHSEVGNVIGTEKELSQRVASNESQTVDSAHVEAEGGSTSGVELDSSNESKRNSEHKKDPTEEAFPTQPEVAEHSDKSQSDVADTTSKDRGLEVLALPADSRDARDGRDHAGLGDGGALDDARRSASGPAQIDRIGKPRSEIQPGRYEVHPEDTDALVKRVESVGRENPNQWIGSVNPRYSTGGESFQNNCGECSRAYAVTVQTDSPAAAAGDPQLGEGDEMWEWAGVKPTNTLTESDSANLKDFQPKAWDHVAAQLKGKPPGTVAIVGVDWEEITIGGKQISGGGHWFNAHMTKDGIKWADSQNGTFKDWPPQYPTAVRTVESIIREPGEKEWKA